MSEEIGSLGDSVALVPIGHQGAAAHTWTSGCAGDHPVSQPCPVDIGNDQFVGMRGDEIVIMAPRQIMSHAEALRHAAWLVAVADPAGEEFERVLKAVRGT